jgi:predicted regulator of Ras-like GTPase activity (Roadblock/LC7/MglB family)
MQPIALEETVAGVTALRGLFITLMPDCLLFDSYVRPGSDFVAEDVASYFGDLVRANREGLKSLRSWSQDMQVTIESDDSLVVLKELRGDFVASFVFDRETPLGMVRLFVRRLLDRLEASLPDTEVAERPRAVRALEFVQRYAPDPHATLMRVALKSGLAMDALQRPETLDDAAADRIEEAALDILGLDQLSY